MKSKSEAEFAQVNINMRSKAQSANFKFLLANKDKKQ